MDREARAYIAGPMAGKPDLNAEAFRSLQSLLKMMGVEALIPHQIIPMQHRNKGCPENYKIHDNSEHAECCYLRNDLLWMLDSCDRIYVLPGWEASNGTRLEVQVAAQCGMEVIFISDYLMWKLENNHTLTGRELGLPKRPEGS